jgi:hypothetical protein
MAMLKRHKHGGIIFSTSPGRQQFRGIGRSCRFPSHGVRAISSPVLCGAHWCGAANGARCYGEAKPICRAFCGAPPSPVSWPSARKAGQAFKAPHQLPEAFLNGYSVACIYFSIGCPLFSDCLLLRVASEFPAVEIRLSECAAQSSISGTWCDLPN